MTGSGWIWLSESGWPQGKLPIVISCLMDIWREKELQCNFANFTRWPQPKIKSQAQIRAHLEQVVAHQSRHRVQGLKVWSVRTDGRVEGVCLVCACSKTGRRKPVQKTLCTNSGQVPNDYLRVAIAVFASDPRNSLFSKGWNGCSGSYFLTDVEIKRQEICGFQWLDIQDPSLRYFLYQARYKVGQLGVRCLSEY